MNEHQKVSCNVYTLLLKFKSTEVMLPSHVIGHFLFPTYEVMITSLSQSLGFAVGKNKM